MEGMSTERLVIASDFDGTVTDVAKEAQRYLEVYSAGLATVLGMDPYEMEAHMQQSRAEIVKNPGMYGWEYDGLIVAPALADPYLTNISAVQLTLERLDKTIERDALDTLHKQAYQYTETVFRPDAQAYVEQLHATTDFTIVTNSKTDRVYQKLTRLLERSRLSTEDIRVVGDAKKYVIDNSWEQVAQTTQPKGFPRPVYLRRKCYHDALFSGGQKPDIVIGDVYELDLALPYALNIWTILLLSRTTPKWEKTYYTRRTTLFQGGAVSTLADVLDEVRG